ncbi:hypothetical protein DCAR_0624064 [Daucus carota subsp. sativus]|uniref:E3 ubiquitin-protein ligase RMA n=1 Tax=Daucus carota subsp. sativus TaxID=79200 RepID=A0AAF0XAU9_DAUCS|nr:PREDICTED: E3 ubiquitin-protein ligase RNF5-like [Daucus carota subsp. sativus]XP_017255008.1 PREDICTED: E3 ubiquitin-protein ligase RNF5-like [Daucus carota subsp. sativus]WOH04653.1 hypothetical protein DCAR_0624064 [Daucus carota subsp. sativus]
MDVGSAFENLMDPSCSSDTKPEMGVFECNICFELAQDPTVTLCGHLYCWPCLYRWLHVHSVSPQCPVCKALIQEEKLVPIYGRGKLSSELSMRSVPGDVIPNRPTGQRPQTAPAPAPFTNFLRQQEEFNSVGEFMPMGTPRFGNLTISALFGAIPSLFNLQVHGFHDATIYGATTGVPYLFSTSFHGGYAHGFYQHSAQQQVTKSLLKICFLFLGLLMILRLISFSLSYS